ncbi:hypothetical protein [Pedobacter gandavensis]|uniref:hypothetical protein n=1 Tax=Pedobacter gandavensis TaxID=2679963 RepID=UPI00292EEF76|nr:hypothetical protein [Pedobacter gandavensis]
MKNKKIRRHPNVEDKIYAVLSNKSSNRWQCIVKVSADAGLRYEDVIQVLNESGKFVLSYGRKQMPVIATRERYRKEEPFLRKLLDAFNNKIV